jgi:hypothetical protein
MSNQNDVHRKQIFRGTCVSSDDICPLFLLTS